MERTRQIELSSRNCAIGDPGGGSPADGWRDSSEWSSTVHPLRANSVGRASQREGKGKPKMAKKNKTPQLLPGGCCRIESLLSIDERGQMVLPKEIRERANIRAGDKLAVVSWENDGQVCCLSLVKADVLTGMIRDVLGPMLHQVMNIGKGKK